MNRALALALGVVCLVGLARAHAADAGAPKAAPAAKPADGGAPAAGAEKKIDWEHATVAEKKKYMKTTVLPTMKKAFIAYNAKYKKMTCTTCHGDGATDGKFKMPNPKLPELPKPTSRDDFIELEKKKPEAVKFMRTVVKPTMARLLGLPEWSPQTTKGFGCYHCHTKEE